MTGGVLFFTGVSNNLLTPERLVNLLGTYLVGDMIESSSSGVIKLLTGIHIAYASVALIGVEKSLAGVPSMEEIFPFFEKLLIGVSGKFEHF